MSTPTPTTLSARKMFDEVEHLIDENLGRLAVLERLCWLMAANHAYDNNQYVDFGDVREAAFWQGLHHLTTATAEAIERMRELTNDLDGNP